MYTLTLSEEQVEAVRIALAGSIDDRQEYEAKAGISTRKDTIVMKQTYAAIAEQWHAQHVAQRDAALREDK